jgi:S-(hydroxymethyl)glutathione dehydrogenase / alcohol dehydrogenase
MQIRAAIQWEAAQPLVVETAELASPGPGEVLVEVRAAGVCHSDLHATNGDWPMRLPLCGGHEGAGVVLDIGSDVTRVRAGDHVVLCWAPACGKCPPCLAGTPLYCDRLDRVTYRNKLPFGGTRLRARDTDIAPFLGTACFSTHVVVPEEGLVTVPADVSFAALATVGCAVVTGVGAVLNAARVPAGAVVAVVGAGGIGLNVIQGARIAGSARIIALDRQAPAVAMAQAFGATDVVEPGAKISEGVRALTQGRGADYVFDTVGSAATLSEAIAATRKGGTTVLTGLSRVDALGSFATFPFVMHEKRLIGSVYGSANPIDDIQRFVSFYREGRLKLDELTARSYLLDGINDALAALARGDGGRGVVLPK